jgi:L-threonylcarbamoyladenylate synthase
MQIRKLDQMDDEGRQKVVAVLARGGLVVYPTETVYGLGVDATSEAALEKLWDFKGERGDKPVLVAVSGVKMAEKYVKLSNLGKKIAQKYWPGAVAIVAISNNRVAKKAHGGEKTLGLRVPANETVLKMIAEFGKPITSTSANVSGAPTARSLAEFLETVPKDKQELVDIFIDAGELPARLPSTIVDTTGVEMKILRQGEIDVII